MKHLRLLTIFSLCAMPAFASAQTTIVNVLVKQNVTQVRHEGKTKGPRVETEKATLEITLSNVSSVELKDLKVKYYVFARSTGAIDLETLKQGDLPATVPAGGTLKLQSDTVSATYTGAGYSKTGRVAPSGQKLAGFGARVTQSSGQVIGEFFSSDSVKKAAK